MSGNRNTYYRSRRVIGKARRTLGWIVVLLAVNIAGVMALGHGTISTGMPGVIVLVLVVFLIGVVVQRGSRR